MKAAYDPNSSLADRFLADELARPFLDCIAFTAVGR
jgi:hypothetical protein